MKFFDVQSPMFRPIWLRLLIVLLGAAWAVFELKNGNMFWAALFGVAAAYLAYQFFVVFDPDHRKDNE